MPTPTVRFLAASVGSLEKCHFAESCRRPPAPKSAERCWTTFRGITLLCTHLNACHGIKIDRKPSTGHRYARNAPA
jgi:hypothetical protein